MIRLRNSCGEISHGTWALQETDNKKMLAIRYKDGKGSLIVVHTSWLQMDAIGQFPVFELEK